MAIKNVLKLGNSFLREESKNINNFGENTEIIVKDLKDTLLSLQEEKNIGRALAAPQIGYLKKVIYANLPEREIVMKNPEIKCKSDEKFMVWDSCFSFDISFFVKILRHKKIEICYQNEEGEKITETFEGDLAELFQHEIDHLYGILATDHLENNKNIIMREEWEKQ